MIKFLPYIFLLSTFLANAQNDTIRIQKSRNDIYKCQTESAQSWYINVDNEQITLADLKINPTEVEIWFQRFKRSQNLYRADYPKTDSTILVFRKSNDPLDTLIFEFIEFTNERILLEIQPSKEVFDFNIFKM